MEFKILFYIVGLIVYFIYSANKASRKRKELSEQKNSPKPQQSWEQELREILQKTIIPEMEEKPAQKREVEYKERTKPVVKVKKVPVKQDILDTVPEKSELGSYQEAKAYDWASYQGQELYSIEKDSTPLSTHIAELEAAMEKKPEGPSVARSIIEEEGFNARKAFLFSEIFKAKYVDEAR